MPAKIKAPSSVCAADIDAALPKKFFVMRGDVQAAFGFTGEEMSTLVEQGVFRAEYPFGKTRTVRKKKQDKLVHARMKFVRSQVMAVARRWEASA